MLRRIRQLKISLAAKCQLLFGAAVVVIIAGALFVPWLRMERLMEQLNEQSSGTLAQTLLSEHLSGARPGPTTLPATIGEHTIVPPRIVPLNRGNSSFAPTRFEGRALDYFQKNPRATFFARKLSDGRYRYAKPLRNEAICAQCHSSDGSANVSSAGTARSLEVAPTQLAGIASVDIPSQIEANQILLNRVVIFTAMLLAGSLAIFFFYVITTRLILQPVRVLQVTAERVSSGDMNIRSDISTGDEFQQLSSTFNTMLVNLKQGADQLRAINTGLDLKIGQLAESNVALYESNRLKSEFLANVSHELRTPLNSILGFAELLRDFANNTGDAKAARYIQNILSSGKNLLDLINDLLDLAKIEAGKMEVRSEPLSLNDLFEGLCNILKPLLESRQLSANPSVASDVPIIQTDPAKLQQVLYNFLSNAIKFSPVGGSIEVKAEREGEERIRISVIDHGPGIEESKQQLIFEKFRQIDGSTTREHSGTGLGLSISKELISLLGGTIGVVSVPGEGATFWVVLPLKIQAGAQDVRGKMILG
jgi:two-component system, NarL family, sensor histidine kinase BarA